MDELCCYFEVPNIIFFIIAIAEFLEITESHHCVMVHLLELPVQEMEFGMYRLDNIDTG